MMHQARFLRPAFLGAIFLAFAGTGTTGCGDGGSAEVSVGGAMVDPEVEEANRKASQGNSDIIKAVKGKSREVGAP